MDIQEMKKVNELSRELQKHGIVKNSQEGATMATSFVNPENREVPRNDIAEKYEVMIERINRKFSSELDTLKDQMSMFRQELTQVKEKMGAPVNVPSQMQSFTSQLQSQTPSQMDRSSQDDRLSQLDRPINSTSQMDRPPQIHSTLAVERPAFSMHSEEPQEQHKAPELRHEMQAKIKTEPKRDHPRIGDYNPEDVAIDKVFYFGKK